MLINRLFVFFVLLLSMAASLSAKIRPQTCTNQFRSQTDACTLAQDGVDGQFIFYWVPNSKAVEIRDAFGYTSTVECYPEPVGEPALWDGRYVWFWSADPSATDPRHCLAADIGTQVSHPLTAQQYIDLQIRNYVRHMLRNQAVDSVVRPVREAEEAKPAPDFEDNPD